MGINYEDRLLRVVRYIHDNPAGDLSLDKLADVAALSRFHWHRVFLAMTGETCAEAVRRIRLQRAAFWLVQTEDPVPAIAARVGYDNPQSFSRAFRETFNTSPVAFRRAGAPLDAPLLIRKGDDPMYDVEIRELPGQRLAGLTHAGSYQEIGRTYEQLSASFSARGLWPQARGMVAAHFCDPTIVAQDDLRSFAGIRVEPDFVLPEDLTEYHLAGGRHAVLTLKGPYTGLKAAYEYLYGPWLAQSGAAPGDGVSFEMYLNSPQDTAPSDLLTEVCAPLNAQDQMIG
jgi:AraC family transcriptional regulator